MKKKHNETPRFKKTPTEYEKETQWNTKIQKDPNRILGSKRPQPNMKKKHNETLRFKKTPTATPTEYEKKNNETLRFKKTPTEYEKKTQWNTKVQKDPNRIWKKKHNETLRFKKTPTE